MQTTLMGKGPKCRVCTHPERTQIESLLARGAGMSAIEPLMRGSFSRRALYRHRAKHMIALGLPAARPVPFPLWASPLKRLKWLQQETEHTAALAEHQGNLSLKLKTLHELGRFIWLEDRLKQGRQESLDVTPDPELPLEIMKKFEAICERQMSGSGILPDTETVSPEEERLQRAFALSRQSYQRSVTNDPGGNEPPSDSEV